MSGIPCGEAFRQEDIDYVKSLVLRAERKDMPVASIEEALERLENMGLAQSMQVPPMLMGSDPRNRGGRGVHPPQVHHILEWTFDKGFSWEAVRTGGRPVATEIHEKRLNLVHEFNKKEVAASDGTLAPVRDASLKWTALRNSHLNGGFRAVLSRCRTSKESIAVDGFLDIDVFQKKNPMHAEAIRGGLKDMLVLKDICEDLFPGLHEMVIETGNVNACVTKPRDELETLYLIARHASEQRFKDASGNTMWDHIVFEVTRPQQPCSPYADVLCKYFRVCGGGTSHYKLLKDTHTWAQAFCPADGRVIQRDLWNALAETTVSIADPAALTKTAIVWALLNAPSGLPFVRYGVCALLSSTEIKKAADPLMVPKVLLNEGFLREVYEELVKFNLPESDFIAIYGVTAVRAVWFTWGKTHSSRTTFDSLAAIGAAFIKQLTSKYEASKSELVHALLADAPWKVTEPPPSAASKKHAPNAGDCVIAYTPDGHFENPTQVATQHGFVLGVYVKCNSVKGMIYEVTRINQSHAIIKEIGGEKLWKVDIKDLITEYRVTDSPIQPKVWDDALAHCASKSEAFLIAVHRGYILEALNLLTDLYPQPKGLALQLHPSRLLRATEKFTKGAVHLVPLTSNVKVRDLSEDRPEKSSGIVLGKVIPSMPNLEFSLHSSNVLPPHDETKKIGKLAVSYYFCVGESDDPEMVNLHSSTFDVKIKNGLIFKIPCYTNMKVIAAGSELCILKAAPIAAPKKAVRPSTSAAGVAKRQRAKG